jgi:putative flippase GtrA
MRAEQDSDRSERSSARFSRFAVVGGIGFVADAGILSLLVSGFGFDPLLSRLPSFATAVTVTWLVNRTWVFARTQAVGYEYVRYLTVQIVGAGINLSTYAAIMVAVPELGRWPVVGLAVGAALSMSFTFAALRRWVYGRRNVDSITSVGRAQR